MSDFFSSVLQYFRTKAKTQLFGIFAAWWAVFHLNYIIALLFVSEDKIFSKTGLLKNEYLQSINGGYMDVGFWVRSVLPFLLTYSTIWYLPKLVVNQVYQKEKDNDYERQKIHLNAEKKIEMLKATFAAQKADTLEKKSKALTVEKNIEKNNPELLWREEYMEFKETGAYHDFGQIIESVYEHSGQIKVDNEYGRTVFEINQGILVYADANELITIDQAWPASITLTPKGKYFVRRYSVDKQTTLRAGVVG